MTSVSITCNRFAGAHIELDGKRLERVLSFTLELGRKPVVEIVQHDDAGLEFSRTFVPTELTLRTVP